MRAARTTQRPADLFPPIHLVLPYPPSANRYWRTFMPKGHARPMVTLSDEAKAFKAAVKRSVAAMGVAAIDGRVAVQLVLYPHRPKDADRRMRKLGEQWDDTVQCIDLDNAIKVSIDALKGPVITDDRWIWSLEARRAEPDTNGARLEVTIRRVEIQCPQRALPIHVPQRRDAFSFLDA